MQGECCVCFALSVKFWFCINGCSLCLVEELMRRYVLVFCLVIICVLIVSEEQKWCLLLQFVVCFVCL